MHHRTATITVAAGTAEVFAFLSDLRNLPGWATEFCRDIRRDGLRWLAGTTRGEMIVAVRADRATGVIDFLVGPAPEAMELFPLRVVGRPAGCAVSFTFAQSEGMPDELYERQYRSLLVELRGLIARFRGGELHAPEAASAPFHPGIVTARLRETVEFYTEMLGFGLLHDCSAYAHLAHPSGVHLGVLRRELDGQPRELINATEGSGFWLNLDVADADAEYARLRALGADLAAPPEDKPWGERIAIVRDPNGVLVFLGHKLAPPPAPWDEPVEREAAAVGV